VTKFSCADHRFSFGGKGHWVNKVEGFLQDTGGSEDRTQGEISAPDAAIEGQPDSNRKPLGKATCVDPAAAAATVRPHKNYTSASATEDICIRCCKAPSLPSPLGCGGQICQCCVDLQNEEYRQWVASERSLGNIPFGNGEPETRLVR